MCSLINPSLALTLVGRIDLLGSAGESVLPLSTSSEAVRLADDSDGCMVGEGENPGIPKTSNDASSGLDSEASKTIIQITTCRCYHTQPFPKDIKFLKFLKQGNHNHHHHHHQMEISSTDIFW